MPRGLGLLGGQGSEGEALGLQGQQVLGCGGLCCAGGGKVYIWPGEVRDHVS